jgi:transcriptional regulator with XRE-family HTH domain
MTNIRDVLAVNLKQFRQARGWNQAFLDEKTETSTNYIGMLENSVKFPSSEMIHKLAYALEIDPTDLFSKEIDPISTMRRYQKAALEDIQTLLDSLINEKIQKLEEKSTKSSI